MLRLVRGLKVIFSFRAWRNIAAVIAFIGYDTLEQNDIHMDRTVRMSPTVSVRNGSRISIGPGSEIGQGSQLWAGNTSGRIDIGDHALLAPNVFVTTSNYDFDSTDGPVMHAGSQERDVFIGDNVWIGTGVVVVAGAHIGHGAIVAAGAVVSGTIPDMAVAAGIPARVVRMRCRTELAGATEGPPS
jgi:acetyltransferase-like isoleucine patch superfamily enzyme